jgi:methylated-DNA-protein-cysteine methyltransferase-like protein
MIKTTFQSKVYALTKQIPAGKVATYGQIASLLGSPNASRAVGMCLSKNTNPQEIPCHRVVAANGKLTGYAFGGVSHKKVILLKEGVRFKGDQVDLTYSLWDGIIFPYRAYKHTRLNHIGYDWPFESLVLHYQMPQSAEPAQKLLLAKCAYLLKGLL